MIAKLLVVVFFLFSFFGVSTADAQMPSITTDMSSVQPGTTITVSWQGIMPPYQNDYILIDFRGLEEGSIESRPVNGQIGGFIYDIGRQGTYEFALYEDGVLVASTTVTSSIVQPSIVTLFINGARAVYPGDNIVVSWEGLNTLDGEWIGMFQVDSPDSMPTSWQYAGGFANSLIFTAPQTPGRYQFRMFSSLGRLAVSEVFRVRGNEAVVNIIANKWEEGNYVTLCRGTEVRHGSGLSYTVEKIITRDTLALVTEMRWGYSGYEWADVTLFNSQDWVNQGTPTGMTGWVRIDQADCNPQEQGSLGKPVVHGYKRPYDWGFAYGSYIKVTDWGLNCRNFAGGDSLGHVFLGEYYPILSTTWSGSLEWAQVQTPSVVCWMALLPAFTDVITG